MSGTRSSTRTASKRAVIVVVALLVAAAGCTTNDLNEDAGASSTLAPVLPTTTTAISTTVISQGSGTSTTAATPITTSSTIPVSEVRLGIERIDTGFDNPVLLVADPLGGFDFVVEQTGSIVRADQSGHELALDLSADVEFGGEKGLLGLAFHPDFLDNGLAYVSYVAKGPHTVIEQFAVSNGVFDRNSRTEIIRIRQPAANHNGGMIAFGPDGYLWIALGDGGGSNDRFANGQDSRTLLGSMLRIAVGIAGIEAYAIPADNPFVDGEGGAPEVWAIGLRNPWRFAFGGDDVWIADVGQGQFEEVNVAPVSARGLNYGWNVLEGSSCFQSSTCDASRFVLPITEYSHDEGCSITGGVVYEGDAMPSLEGQFFYADYCTGIVRSISRQGQDHLWTDVIGGGIDRPTGFGIGRDAEVYIVTQNGELLKLVERDG
jgi:glucose/arabinose dehydrogenase